MIRYLKRLISSTFVRVKAFPVYGGIGVSAPSLVYRLSDECSGQSMSCGFYDCMHGSIATITHTSEITAAIPPNTATTTTTTTPSTETTATITLALVGGVGGIMGLIIVCQSLVIVVLLRQEMKRRNRTKLVQSLCVCMSMYILCYTQYLR